MYAQNFGTGSKWLSAVIQEVTGPVSFLVKLQDGRIVRQHQDHLRRRLATPEPEVPTDEMQNRPSQEDTTDDVEFEIPSGVTPSAVVTPPASDPTDTESTDMSQSATSSNTDVVSPSVENSRSSVVNESIETSETTASELNASPSMSNT